VARRDVTSTSTLILGLASQHFVLLGVDDKNRGKVFFWDHEEGADEGEKPTRKNVTQVAKTFGDFLESLRKVD
jgi:hypothetical protein